MVKFEKVSLRQFEADVKAAFGDGKFSAEEIRKAYERITIPVRADMGSAGYDLSTPFGFKLGLFRKRIKIPTGIRAKFDKKEVLLIFPRSGKGVSTGYHLTNTVGVIDSSYYGNLANEGDIIVCLSRGHRGVSFGAGDRFAQGVVVRIDISGDGENNKKNVRKGGFGSSGR